MKTNPNDLLGADQLPIINATEVLQNLKKEIDNKSKYFLIANAHPIELEYLEGRIWEELSKMFQQAFNDALIIELNKKQEG